MVEAWAGLESVGFAKTEGMGPCWGAVNQLVLVGALIAGTHPFILPESLGMLVEFLEV